LQQSLRDLDLAFQHFFRRIKLKATPGYPRFKCKGEKDSFRYPQGVKVKDNRVYLPKIGWINFKKSREIQGEIKQVTVINEGGKWHVCFSCEIEVKDKPLSKGSSTIGIDVGIKRFATIATDEGIEKIENLNFLKKGLSKIKYLSKRFSIKKKKSKKRLDAKLKLILHHAKIRNKRRDFLHKLSTKLVNSHDKIIVENLNIKSLLQKSPKTLSFSISDVGWGEFLEMLKYKTKYSFKIFKKADKYFPSTQLCSNCQKKKKIDLSVRTYKCTCGLIIDRDDNSALNLKAVGTTV
jgi:putative transposase